MNTVEHELVILSGTATYYLSQKIADELKTELGRVSIARFSDGEFEPCIDESVRGKYVFIIQSTFPNSDNLMELLLMIDAAKRASAYQVAAVVPYFGYARQDRKSKPRVPIGAKLIANLLEAAGADRVITLDLHANQIQGFFDIPVDHLQGASIFIPYIKKLGLTDVVFGSPDVGGTKRAEEYAKYFNTDMVICHKYREKPNEVSEMRIIGYVKDKHVILIDDIIDTGGTITKAANLIKENGAKSVRVIISHGLFSHPAIERIDQSNIEEVLVLDTIPLKQPSKKITVLSSAKLIADVIFNNHQSKSISASFVR